MKIASTIIGFILVCIGIAAFAGQTPLLGIHPAVWFILGCGLMLSDSAWERLARSKRDKEAPNTPDDERDEQDTPASNQRI